MKRSHWGKDQTREVSLEYQRLYRLAFPEKFARDLDLCREYKRLFRLAFPERHRASNAAYKRSPAGKLVNKKYAQSEKGKDKSRRYWQSEKGKQAHARNQKIYRQTPNGKAHHLCDELRRKTRKLAIKTDDGIAESIVFEIRTTPILTCTYCGVLTTPSTRHTDHIIPLARGGTHTGDNLTPACAGCNLSKGDQNIDAWLNSLL